MSIFKHHEDNLSESFRRTAVGLKGLQKLRFSDLRKILGGGGLQGHINPFRSLR